MKKHIILILTALICLTCSSCMDLLEEITLNKDGSGTYFMEMDMAKMMEKVAAMMPEEKRAEMAEKGFMKDDDLKELDSMVTVMNAIDGINNYAYQTEGFKVSFSFDFDDLNTFSQAMNQFYSQNNSMPGPPGMKGLGQSSMSIEQKGNKYTFNRAALEEAEASDDEKSSEEKEKMEKMMGMFGTMMEGGTYTSIINFPGKAKVSGNKYATLSKDKKTMTIKADIAEMMENPDLPYFGAKYKVK